MPAWSIEVANELVRMAAADGRQLNQMQLQDLVYIAHGWCLALTGEPLTGDRPEALEHGPEYRRLAIALEHFGVDPVLQRSKATESGRTLSQSDPILCSARLMSDGELAILAQTYANYAPLRLGQLATLTRAEGTPWHRVFDGGRGKSRDITHGMIRDQFAEFARQLDRREDRV